MPLALAVVGGTITVINGTFTLALTVLRLVEVDEDLKICLKLLANAHRDLNYARQLRAGKFTSKQRDYYFTEFSYIENVIDDMEKATLAVGQLVEAYRVDSECNNSISVPHRFKWVFRGKDRFLAQQWHLNMAHNSLLSAIQKMENLTPVAGFLAPPTYAEAALATDVPVLRSPSQQRRLKGKSSMILRVDNWPERVLSTKSPAPNRPTNLSMPPTI